MTTPTAGTPTALVASAAYDAFPVATRCATGDVLGAYVTGADHVTRDADSSLLRSTDGGSTFSAAGSVTDSKVSALITLADGTVVLGAWDNGVYSGLTPYSHSRRSTDHGDTFAAAVDVPHPWADRWGLVESFAECTNDDLLAFSYGRLTTDTNRSISQARSTDGAGSWADEGTIFDGDTLGIDCTEPQVIRLDNGDLLMLVRDDSAAKDIYSSRSTDNGASWSALTLAFDGTGRPSCYQAADGTVLAMYRSNDTGNPLRFRASDDRGVSWSDEADFTGGSALKMEYGAFVPLAGGRTGVVYALEATLTDSDIYWNTLETSPPSVVGGYGFWRSTTASGPGSGVSAHNDLTGRDAPDAHPTSAITGLDATLADLAAASSDETVFAPAYTVTDGTALDLAVTFVWGIDAAGDPYYNAVGVAAGDEAVLVLDNATGEFSLRPVEV